MSIGSRRPDLRYEMRGAGSTWCDRCRRWWVRWAWRDVGVSLSTSKPETSRPHRGETSSSAASSRTRYTRRTVDSTPVCVARRPHLARHPVASDPEDWQAALFDSCAIPPSLIPRSCAPSGATIADDVLSIRAQRSADTAREACSPPCSSSSSSPYITSTTTERNPCVRRYL